MAGSISDADAAALLRRLGFGPRPEDVDQLRRAGLAAWLETQLAAGSGDEPEVAARLKSLSLRIHYPAGPGTPLPNGVVQDWPAADEMRPVGFLDQPIEAIWHLTDRKVALAPQERGRPRDEVIAATMIRAAYSPWQLREVMTGFWHDHFNVDAYGGGDQIAVALPSYDRDVIRPHAFGNFRELLEAVATSTAMQYYLSNQSSRAGSANENYGRELFELHTLGRDAYLNDRYDRWKDVPGALKDRPVGYIDEDVYEAARAFTGWTIENGARIDNHTQLPQTGRFRYVESWHDGYQKRVLATDFDPFQPPMADGRKVLDLVAAHPATAHFIAKKLCRRLIGQNPPEATIRMAAAVFHSHAKAPDQIARTVRAIVLSPGFRGARTPKIRRPLQVAIGFVRATGIDFTPTEGLSNALAVSGQRLFGWPSPDGYPDDDTLLLNANGLRQHWTLAIGLAVDAWNTGPLPADLAAPTPAAAARHWLTAFNGVADEAEVAAVSSGLDWPPDAPVTAKRLALIAGYCAAAPSFQTA